jgi:hypothetical protein
MDICSWLRVCLWRAARKNQTETAPKKRRKYIDEIMK